MALKLRRQAGMITTEILLHRFSGRAPEALRAGADSFKRLLGGGISDRYSSSPRAASRAMRGVNTQRAAAVTR